MKTIRLKLAPNEDGFGPSMAMFYVVRGLYREAEKRQIDLHLTIQNHSKAGFNRTLYSDWIKAGKAEIVAKHSIIQIAKDGERVRPRETAEMLLDYPSASVTIQHILYVGRPILPENASRCS